MQIGTNGLQWNGQLWESGGQRSTSHETED